MTEQNIQIKDLSGNNLFPKTKASLVTNNQGENLGDVEAGAQVNYLAGTGIIISDNKVNVDTTTIATKNDLGGYMQLNATATKSTADALGNEITSTYATKGEVNAVSSQINSKANTATTLSGYGITDALTYEVLT